MNTSWQNVSREFDPDGSLRDIYVSPVTLADWQRVIDFVREGGSEVSYSLDGQPSQLPASVSESFAARQHSSPSLTFRLGGVHFATHFFSDDELEFDFSPSDIHCQGDLDLLLGFIQRVGDLLTKPVSITPENCREDAFLVYHPDSRAVSYTPAVFNRNV